jgi:hypothetical protein
MSGAPGVAEPGVRMTDRVDSRSLSTSTLDYGIGHLDKQQVKIESPDEKAAMEKELQDRHDKKKPIHCKGSFPGISSWIQQ